MPEDSAGKLVLRVKLLSLILPAIKTNISASLKVLSGKDFLVGNKSKIFSPTTLFSFGLRDFSE